MFDKRNKKSCSKNILEGINTSKMNLFHAIIKKTLCEYQEIIEI